VILDLPSSKHVLTVPFTSPEAPFRRRSLVLPLLPGAAQPPLFFKKLDYRLLKCRLVRREVVVAFTCGGACGCDYFEKALDFLIGGVGSTVDYQDRYLDSPGVLPRAREVRPRRE
jgi:hypothetical protein